jgi:hypothetical protein
LPQCSRDGGIGSQKLVKQGQTLGTHLHRSLNRANTTCKVHTQDEQPKKNRMQKVLFSIEIYRVETLDQARQLVLISLMQTFSIAFSLEGTLLLFALVKPVLHVISSAAELVKAKNRNLHSTVLEEVQCHRNNDLCRSGFMTLSPVPLQEQPAVVLLLEGLRSHKVLVIREYDGHEDLRGSGHRSVIPYVYG